VISYWLIGFGLLFLLISGLWLLVPALYGVPWVPTREKRIRKALQLAELRAGETLYDLGAGDGRVLIMAAKEFGARAIGIEIGPVQCLIGWLRIWFSGHRPRRGSRPRARMRCANFYKSDVSDADVVFVYVTSSQTSKLLPLLERQLRPGARVVSVAADFLGWQPNHVDREMLIFVYQMPPTHVGETSLFPNRVQ
jgi:SAM-dependent methyltransferase